MTDLAGLTAAGVIELLELAPHPEGGHFRETFRDSPPGGGRGHCTAIYYLLAAGEVGRWHRVDAAEIWHWYGGETLELSIAPDGDTVPVRHRLGPDFARGERPQIVVPPGAWQGARPLGAWTLVGCTVAPAFEFAHFEMAPEGWEPGGA